MDVYKSKIYSNGSLGKLKFKILVRVDLYNKEFWGYIWSPIASVMTSKCTLEDVVKHKSKVNQFYFIA